MCIRTHVGVYCVLISTVCCFLGVVFVTAAIYTFYPEFSLKCRNVINPKNSNLGWRPEVRYILLPLLDQSPGDRLIDRFLSMATCPMREQVGGVREKLALTNIPCCRRSQLLAVQPRAANRAEFRNSRARQFSSDLQGSSRSCSLLLWGFHSDPWELSFDFIDSFYFYFQSLVILIFASSNKAATNSFLFIFSKLPRSFF